MFLSGGNFQVDGCWAVEEKKAAGFLRIYLVYHGITHYRDARVQQTLKPGYLYIFPTTNPYYMDTDPADTLFCTFLHLDIYPVLVNRLIEIPPGKYPILDSIMGAVKAAYDEEYLDVVPHLTDALEKWCLKTNIWERPSQFISQLHNYITKHYQEPLSNRDLSVRYGYNEQYFIRLFKSSTGVTPHQYIISYRLKQVVQLLKKSDSISEVAEKTGFKDTKALCRAFQQHYGISPGRYKRYICQLP